jgi:hypothetical protein
MLAMADYEVDFEVDWRVLAARDPGADLLDVIPVGLGPVDLDFPSDVPVTSLDADSALDELVANERGMAARAARKMRLLSRIAQLRPGGDPDNVMSEFASDEVAPALRVTRNSASVQLDLATRLTGRLPATLAALARGEIDLDKARAVVELTDPLSDEQAAAVWDRVMGRACSQTSSQLRASLRRAVLRVDPEGAARRHEERRKDRRVELIPLPDAMAQLTAYLPAEVAVAIYKRLDVLACKARTPGDMRSADERRADVYADLLLDSGAAVQVKVQVTVPASTLLGTSDQPGELAGYGSIPAALARRIAEDPRATWHRLLTDPVDGGLLDYGRTTYRPPANLNDHVRARDVTCRFFGCQQPSDRTDLDHTQPYPAGPTSADNLGALCRTHHRLKHETGWTLEQDQGNFIWTSPTGRTYTRTPEPIGDVPDDPPPF